ncbi:hypothetical protein ACFPRL_06645 [Pseudoclavibacter helvolus]
MPSSCTARRITGIDTGAGTGTWVGGFLMLSGAPAASRPGITASAGVFVVKRSGVVPEQHDALTAAGKFGSLDEHLSLAVTVGLGVAEQDGDADSLAGQERAPLDLVGCCASGSR